MVKELKLEQLTRKLKKKKKKGKVEPVFQFFKIFFANIKKKFTNTWTNMRHFYKKISSQL